MGTQLRIETYAVRLGDLIHSSVAQNKQTAPILSDARGWVAGAKDPLGVPATDHMRRRGIVHSSVITSPFYMRTLISALYQPLLTRLGRVGVNLRVSVSRREGEENSWVRLNALNLERR